MDQTGAAGRQFGPYVVHDLIGAGAMGQVYRAEDTRHDRWVALKLLPDVFGDDHEFELRFRRESRVAARLNEPHIIPIHDYGDIDGRLFIDMRLVDGEDLATLLQRTGPLPPERAVRLVTQIADALDAAHAEGLVHRDIKPSNVLVTPRDFVYVVDFGIARSCGETRTSLTATGTTVGTLEYMAPERFTNRPVDGRADVYSLACLLAECLTGQRPFRGGDLPSLMHAHLHAEPPRPSTLRAGLPGGLDTVIARGMAKDPADRFPSAGDLAVAAQAALGPAPAVARPRTSPETVVAPAPVRTPAAAPRPATARLPAAPGTAGSTAEPSVRPTGSTPGQGPGDPGGPAGPPGAGVPTPGVPGDDARTHLTQGPPGGVPPAGPAAPTGEPEGDEERTGRRAGLGRPVVLAVLGLVVLLAAVLVAVVLHGGGTPARQASGADRPAAERSGTPSPGAATTAALSQPAVVTVPGTVAWTPTGIHVAEGQRLVVHATGQVGFIGGVPPVGPNGAADLHPGACVLPGPEHHAALIGRISGQTPGAPFLVGQDFDGPAGASGELQLGINDVGVDNNDGAFQATVQVSSR